MSWRPRNIRTRLALGFAVAVGVTVLVYATVVYVFTRSSLLAQLDARLRTDIEQAEHGFEKSDDGALRWMLVEADEHHSSPQSHWVEVSPTSGGPTLRRPDPVARDISSDRVRAIHYDVGGASYRIRAGRSMAPLQAELNSLLRLLGLGLVPAVCLAWLAGLVLARRALRPVDDMARQARLIGAEQLSQRLPVHNPDDELGRLAIVFNDAFARLEGSFNQLSRFTSDAAHELRTPLAALRSVGEVGLGRAPDVAAYREVIQSMLEETGRLTRLVETLLDLTRGDAGLDLTHVAPVDCVVLAQSVCDLLSVLAGERDQVLVVEGDASATIQGEEVALRRVFTNLVDNAIQHGKRGGHTWVRVQDTSECVVVCVEDDGPGVPDAHKGRVFDRFHRVDPSREGSSAGLGLSIAAQAIARHGGRIVAEDRSGGGTVIRVTLPKSPGEPRS